LKNIGIIFNIRKMFAYFILLIIGLSLMCYGVISYYEDKRTFETALSDDEIILRAKTLGLVEVKEQIPSSNIKNENNEEVTEATEAIDTIETTDTTEGE